MSLTVADGFPYYISLVESTNLKELFRSETNLNLFSSLSQDQVIHRYAPGKWNIKQIIGHITDHERIMTYRALRFSRKDTTPLSGYDQDVMVNNSRFNELDVKDLIKDFWAVRQATLTLLDSFSAEQLQLKGQAWKFTLTVEEFLRATIGHEMHHINVIKERYLK